MLTSTTENRVSVGDPAPDFVLKSDENREWELSDHLDEPVVLLFFPGAFTSVCTTELETVSSEETSFGSAHVVGISTDSAPVLSKYRSEHGFTFPLLSDHDASVSEGYGARYRDGFPPMNSDRVSKRAAFVIDREGIVQYAEVLEDAGQQPDYGAIEATLAEIR